LITLLKRVWLQPVVQFGDIQLLKLMQLSLEEVDK